MCSLSTFLPPFILCGLVAQSVRALTSQPRGSWFESGIGHVVHIDFSAIIDNWFVGVSIMLPTVVLLKIFREVGDVKLIYQVKDHLNLFYESIK